MFPGRSVAAMFEPWDSNELPMATGTVSLENASQSNESLAGVTAIYASRTEFSSNLPATKLFDEARRVDAVGLSLNILCQGYPDVKLHRLLRRAEMRFLFLDPDGRAIRDRNNEEGHEEGHLSALTRSNISFIQRLRLQLEGEAASRVEVKVYDETVRFNLMFIDEELGVMQTYLPGLRGLASPTFVMSRQSGGATGLYEVYADLFEQIWQGGRTL
jgi:hypothetical protein